MRSGRHRPSARARKFDDDTPVERPPTLAKASDPAVERLCSRTAEVIEMRLTSCGESALEGYRVAGVIPLSGIKLLLIALAPLDLEQEIRVEVAAAAAQRAAGYFRREVALTLNRKQAPQLRFTIVPVDWRPGASQGVT